MMTFIITYKLTLNIDRDIKRMISMVIMHAWRDRHFGGGPGCRWLMTAEESFFGVGDARRPRRRTLSSSSEVELRISRHEVECDKLTHFL